MGRIDEQPELLPVSQESGGGALFAPEPSTEGDYTGERLFASEPRLYQAICAMIAAGMGIRAIVRAVGVHHRTVAAIRDREGVTIDTIRAGLGAELLRVAELGTEAVVEGLGTGRAVSSKERRDLMIAVGVAVDKHQLLTGGVTSRVEVVRREPEHSDFNRWIEGEASEMGCGGETPGQREGAAGAGAGERRRLPAAGREPGPGGESSNQESEDQGENCPQMRGTGGSDGTHGVDSEAGSVGSEGAGTAESGGPDEAVGEAVG